MSEENNTKNAAELQGKISQSDADDVVAAVLNYAMNSDKQFPLSQEALVGFTESLIQAVITVRSRCVSA